MPIHKDKRGEQDRRYLVSCEISITDQSGNSYVESITEQQMFVIENKIDKLKLDLLCGKTKEVTIKI
jgi:hypothetical protein